MCGAEQAFRGATQRLTGAIAPAGTVAIDQPFIEFAMRLFLS